MLIKQLLYDQVWSLFVEDPRREEWPQSNHGGKILISLFLDFLFPSQQVQTLLFSWESSIICESPALTTLLFHFRAQSGLSFSLSGLFTCRFHWPLPTAFRRPHSKPKALHLLESDSGSLLSEASPITIAFTYHFILLSQPSSMNLMWFLLLHSSVLFSSSKYLMKASFRVEKILLFVSLRNT